MQTNTHAMQTCLVVMLVVLVAAAQDSDLADPNLERLKGMSFVTPISNTGRQASPRPAGRLVL